MDEHTEHLTETAEEPEVIQPKYRFIKLSSGEDIVCEMIKDSNNNGYIMIKDPMKVSLVLRPDGGATFGFSRWMPFTAHRFVAVSKLSIVALADLNEEAVALFLGCRASVEETVQEITEDTSEAQEDGSGDDSITQASPGVTKSWIN